MARTPTITDTRLAHAVFVRAFRHGCRWDEGLWRWAELGAVLELLRDQPHLREGPALDLGCGDGEVFETVFGPRSDACGVDSCVTRPDDVARARAAGRYGEVRQEDAASTSFESDRFQLVFSNSVLEHIAPVDPVLREAFRVLRPGGHILFTTPAPRLYSREAYAWRRALAPLGLDSAGRRVAARECAIYHHVSILDPADWVRRLEVVGFRNVEIRGYMPEAAALTMSLFSGATRVPVLSRFARWISPEARALAAHRSEAEWVERCRTVLGPLLREPGAAAGGDRASRDSSGSGGSPGYCGQLVLARKP